MLCRVKSSALWHGRLFESLNKNTVAFSAKWQCMKCAATAALQPGVFLPRSCRVGGPKPASQKLLRPQEKPKLGKSWWAYDASIAVATGGKAMGSVDCEQGDVLYLALEDNRRRVKDRLLTLCPARKVQGINLDRLSVRTIAPRIDTGLLAELDKWRQQPPARDYRRFLKSQATAKKRRRCLCGGL
jgi:hypothetical protein